MLYLVYFQAPLMWVWRLITATISAVSTTSTMDKIILRRQSRTRILQQSSKPRGAVMESSYCWQTTENICPESIVVASTTSRLQNRVRMSTPGLKSTISLMALSFWRQITESTWVECIEAETTSRHIRVALMCIANSSSNFSCRKSNNVYRWLLSLKVVTPTSFSSICKGFGC